MLNNSKSFLLINKKLIYNNFKKDIQVVLDKSWLNKDNYKSLFNKFDTNYSLYLYHKKVKFFDYANESEIRKLDYLENLELHKIKTQPSLALYEEANDELPITDNTIQFIAEFVFGMQKIVRFHQDDVFLKNVPSVGARHGISLFYQSSKKLFYFNPIKKKLVKTPELTRDGDKWLICLRPEVYMWRYKTSYCIFDIYYDIGHIVGCINLLNLFVLKNINISFHFPKENYTSIETKNIFPVLDMVTTYD